MLSNCSFQQPAEVSHVREEYDLGIKLWEEIKVSFEISREYRFNDDEAKALEVGVVEIDKPRVARIRQH